MKYVLGCCSFWQTSKITKSNWSEKASPSADIERGPGASQALLAVDENENAAPALVRRARIISFFFEAGDAVRISPRPHVRAHVCAAEKATDWI